MKKAKWSYFPILANAFEVMATFLIQNLMEFKQNDEKLKIDFSLNKIAQNEKIRPLCFLKFLKLKKAKWFYSLSLINEKKVMTILKIWRFFTIWLRRVILWVLEGPKNIISQSQIWSHIDPRGVHNGKTCGAKWILNFM